MLTSDQPLRTKSGKEKPARNDMTATRCVAEVGSSQKLGVIFFMKQSWWTKSFSYFCIDIHAPHLGTKWEGDIKTLSGYFPSFPKRPVVKPGYLAVGELEYTLTYGKMEAGAETSPQQQPRRKPVLHCLEDQKRVSKWMILFIYQILLYAQCCVTA